jgi:tRNA threonylcarbamoyladenosine biosynthesis protein TsaE
METYKITTHSEQETIAIAQNLESEKFPKMVICLNGDLGSGKTVFAKGFAQAMGITEVTSPTFNIVKEYFGELPLYHMDMYRVEGNVENLGLNEYYERNGVTIIEWAEMIEDYLPEERLEIKFKIVDEETRVLVINAYGDKYIAICEAAL